MVYLADTDPDLALGPLRAAACTYRIALGPRAGQKARHIRCPIEVSLLHAVSYVFTCQRCIELNPVRAAMVEDPGHYRWANYRVNVLGQASALMTPHGLYWPLGVERATSGLPAAARPRSD